MAVHEIPSNKNGNNTDYVLGELTELLEKGGIVNVAAIAISNNGDVHHVWANTNKNFTMVGAMEMMKTDYIKTTIE